MRSAVAGPVAIESPRGWLDFITAGVHHILAGADHLAFVVLLLIPASLMPSWLMISGRRRKSLIPVLKQTGLINLGYAVLFSLGLVLSHGF